MRTPGPEGEGEELVCHCMLGYASHDQEPRPGVIGVDWEGRKEGRKKERKEGKVPASSRSGAVALSDTCVLVVREKYLKTGAMSLYGCSDG